MEKKRKGNLHLSFHNECAEIIEEKWEERLQGPRTDNVVDRQKYKKRRKFEKKMVLR